MLEKLRPVASVDRTQTEGEMGSGAECRKIPKPSSKALVEWRRCVFLKLMLFTLVNYGGFMTLNVLACCSDVMV